MEPQPVKRRLPKKKKTARKSGPRCVDLPGKLLEGSRQIEAYLHDLELNSASKSDDDGPTVLPIPRHSKQDKKRVACSLETVSTKSVGESDLVVRETNCAESWSFGAKSGLLDSAAKLQNETSTLQLANRDVPSHVERLPLENKNVRVKSGLVSTGVKLQDEKPRDNEEVPDNFENPARTLSNVQEEHRSYKRPNYSVSKDRDYSEHDASGVRPARRRSSFQIEAEDDSFRNESDIMVQRQRPKDLAVACFKTQHDEDGYHHANVQPSRILGNSESSLLTSQSKAKARATFAKMQAGEENDGPRQIKSALVQPSPPRQITNLVPNVPGGALPNVPGGVTTACIRSHVNSDPRLALARSTAAILSTLSLTSLQGSQPPSRSGSSPDLSGQVQEPLGRVEGSKFAPVVSDSHRVAFDQSTSSTSGPSEKSYSKMYSSKSGTVCDTNNCAYGDGAEIPQENLGQNSEQSGLNGHGIMYDTFVKNQSMNGNNFGTPQSSSMAMNYDYSYANYHCPTMNSQPGYAYDTMGNDCSSGYYAAYFSNDFQNPTNYDYNYGYRPPPPRGPPGPNFSQRPRFPGPRPRRPFPNPRGPCGDPRLLNPNMQECFPRGRGRPPIPNKNFQQQPRTVVTSVSSNSVPNSTASTSKSSPQSSPAVVQKTQCDTTCTSPAAVVTSASVKSSAASSKSTSPCLAKDDNLCSSSMNYNRSDANIQTQVSQASEPAMAGRSGSKTVPAERDESERKLALINALDTVQNKILNQIDSTAKTMASATAKAQSSKKQLTDQITKVKKVCECSRAEKVRNEISKARQSQSIVDRKTKPSSDGKVKTAPPKRTDKVYLDRNKEETRLQMESIKLIKENFRVLGKGEYDTEKEETLSMKRRTSSDSFRRSSTESERSEKLKGKKDSLEKNIPCSFQNVFGEALHTDEGKVYKSDHPNDEGSKSLKPATAKVISSSSSALSIKSGSHSSSSLSGKSGSQGLSSVSDSKKLMSSSSHASKSSTDSSSIASKSGSSSLSNKSGSSSLTSKSGSSSHASKSGSSSLARKSGSSSLATNKSGSSSHASKSGSSSLARKSGSSSLATNKSGSSSHASKSGSSSLATNKSGSSSHASKSGSSSLARKSGSSSLATNKSGSSSQSSKSGSSSHASKSGSNSLAISIPGSSSDASKSGSSSLTSKSGSNSLASKSGPSSLTTKSSSSSSTSYSGSSSLTSKSSSSSSTSKSGSSSLTSKSGSHGSSSLTSKSRSSSLTSKSSSSSLTSKSRSSSLTSKSDSSSLTSKSDSSSLTSKSSSHGSSSLSNKSKSSKVEQEKTVKDHKSSSSKISTESNKRSSSETARKSDSKSKSVFSTSTGSAKVDKVRSLQKGSCSSSNESLSKIILEKRGRSHSFSSNDGSSKEMAIDIDENTKARHLSHLKKYAPAVARSRSLYSTSSDDSSLSLAQLAKRQSRPNSVDSSVGSKGRGLVDSDSDGYRKTASNRSGKEIWKKSSESLKSTSSCVSGVSNSSHGSKYSSHSHGSSSSHQSKHSRHKYYMYGLKESRVEGRCKEERQYSKDGERRKGSMDRDGGSRKDESRRLKDDYHASRDSAAAKVKSHDGKLPKERFKARSHMDSARKIKELKEKLKKIESKLTGGEGYKNKRYPSKISEAEKTSTNSEGEEAKMKVRHEKILALLHVNSRPSPAPLTLTGADEYVRQSSQVPVLYKSRVPSFLSDCYVNLCRMSLKSVSRKRAVHLTSKLVQSCSPCGTPSIAELVKDLKSHAKTKDQVCSKSAKQKDRVGLSVKEKTTLVTASKRIRRVSDSSDSNSIDNLPLSERLKRLYAEKKKVKKSKNLPRVKSCAANLKFAKSKDIASTLSLDMKSPAVKNINLDEERTMNLKGISPSVASESSSISCLKTWQEEKRVTGTDMSQDLEAKFKAEVSKGEKATLKSVEKSKASVIQDKPKKAKLDANSNVVGEVSCNGLKGEMGSATEDSDTLVIDTCLDTSLSSEDMEVNFCDSARHKVAPLSDTEIGRSNELGRKDLTEAIAETFERKFEDLQGIESSSDAVQANFTEAGCTGKTERSTHLDVGKNLKADGKKSLQEDKLSRKDTEVDEIAGKINEKDEKVSVVEASEELSDKCTLTVASAENRNHESNAAEPNEGIQAQGTEGRESPLVGMPANADGTPDMRDKFLTKSQNTVPLGWTSTPKLPVAPSLHMGSNVQNSCKNLEAEKLVAEVDQVEQNVQYSNEGNKGTRHTSLEKHDNEGQTGEQNEKKDYATSEALEVDSDLDTSGEKLTQSTERDGKDARDENMFNQTFGTLTAESGEDSDLKDNSLNQTVSTINISMTEDPTFLYGDNSFDVEKLNSHRVVNPCLADEDREVTVIMSDKGHREDREMPRLSPVETSRHQNRSSSISSQCETDSVSNHLPELKAVSPVQFNDEPLSNLDLPKPEVQSSKTLAEVVSESVQFSYSGTPPNVEGDENKRYGSEPLSDLDLPKPEVQSSKTLAEVVSESVQSSYSEMPPNVEDEENINRHVDEPLSNLDLPKPEVQSSKTLAEVVSESVQSSYSGTPPNVEGEENQRYGNVKQPGQNVASDLGKSPARKGESLASSDIKGQKSEEVASCRDMKQVSELDQVFLNVLDKVSEQRSTANQSSGAMAMGPFGDMKLASPQTELHGIVNEFGEKPGRTEEGKVSSGPAVPLLGKERGRVMNQASAQTSKSEILEKQGESDKLTITGPPHAPVITFPLGQGRDESLEGPVVNCVIRKGQVLIDLKDAQKKLPKPLADCLNTLQRLDATDEEIGSLKKNRMISDTQNVVKLVHHHDFKLAAEKFSTAKGYSSVLLVSSENANQGYQSTSLYRNSTVNLDSALLHGTQSSGALAILPCRYFGDMSSSGIHAMQQSKLLEFQRICVIPELQSADEKRTSSSTSASSVVQVTFGEHISNKIEGVQTLDQSMLQRNTPANEQLPTGQQRTFGSSSIPAASAMEFTPGQVSSSQIEGVQTVEQSTLQRTARDNVQPPTGELRALGTASTATASAKKVTGRQLSWNESEHAKSSKQSGAPCVEAKAKRARKSYSDEDVALFKERLSESFDSVLVDLRQKMSKDSVDSKAASDIFANSKLSMHQPFVAGKTSKDGTKKRKRRNSDNSCARTCKVRYVCVDLGSLTSDDSNGSTDLNRQEYSFDHTYSYGLFMASLKASGDIPRCEDSKSSVPEKHSVDSPSVGNGERHERRTISSLSALASQCLELTKSASSKVLESESTIQDRAGSVLSGTGIISQIIADSATPCQQQMESLSTYVATPVVASESCQASVSVSGTLALKQPGNVALTEEMGDTVNMSEIGCEAQDVEMQENLVLECEVPLDIDEVSRSSRELEVHKYSDRPMSCEVLLGVPVNSAEQNVETSNKMAMESGTTISSLAALASNAVSSGRCNAQEAERSDMNLHSQSGGLSLQNVGSPMIADALTPSQDRDKRTNASADGAQVDDTESDKQVQKESAKTFERHFMQAFLHQSLVEQEEEPVEQEEQPVFDADPVQIKREAFEKKDTDTKGNIPVHTKAALLVSERCRTESMMAMEMELQEQEEVMNTSDISFHSDEIDVIMPSATSYMSVIDKSNKQTSVTLSFARNANDDPLTCEGSNTVMQREVAMESGSPHVEEQDLNRPESEARDVPSCEMQPAVEEGRDRESGVSHLDEESEDHRSCSIEMAAAIEESEVVMELDSQNLEAEVSHGDWSSAPSESRGTSVRETFTVNDEGGIYKEFETAEFKEGDVERPDTVETNAAEENSSIPMESDMLNFGEEGDWNRTNLPEEERDIQNESRVMNFDVRAGGLGTSEQSDVLVELNIAHANSESQDDPDSQFETNASMVQINDLEEPDLLLSDQDANIMAPVEGSSISATEEGAELVSATGELDFSLSKQTGSPDIGSLTVSQPDCTTTEVGEDTCTSDSEAHITAAIFGERQKVSDASELCFEASDVSSGSEEMGDTPLSEFRGGEQGLCEMASHESLQCENTENSGLTIEKDGVVLLSTSAAKEICKDAWQPDTEDGGDRSCGSSVQIVEESAQTCYQTDSASIQEKGTVVLLSTSAAAEICNSGELAVNEKNDHDESRESMCMPGKTGVEKDEVAADTSMNDKKEMVILLSSSVAEEICNNGLLSLQTNSLGESKESAGVCTSEKWVSLDDEKRMVTLLSTRAAEEIHNDRVEQFPKFETEKSKATGAQNVMTRTDDKFESDAFSEDEKVAVVLLSKLEAEVVNESVGAANNETMESEKTETVGSNKRNYDGAQEEEGLEIMSSQRSPEVSYGETHPETVCPCMDVSHSEDTKGTPHICDQADHEQETLVTRNSDEERLSIQKSSVAQEEPMEASNSDCAKAETFVPPDFEKHVVTSVSSIGEDQLSGDVQTLAEEDSCVPEHGEPAEGYGETGKIGMGERVNSADQERGKVTSPTSVIGDMNPGGQTNPEVTSCESMQFELTPEASREASREAEETVSDEDQLLSADYRDSEDAQGKTRTSNIIEAGVVSLNGQVAVLEESRACRDAEKAVFEVVNSASLDAETTEELRERAVKESVAEQEKLAVAVLTELGNMILPAPLNAISDETGICKSIDTAGGKVCTSEKAEVDLPSKESTVALPEGEIGDLCKQDTEALISVSSEFKPTEMAKEKLVPCGKSVPDILSTRDKVADVILLPSVPEETNSIAVRTVAEEVCQGSVESQLHKVSNKPCGEGSILHRNTSVSFQLDESVPLSATKGTSTPIRDEMPEQRPETVTLSVCKEILPEVTTSVDRAVTNQTTGAENLDLVRKFVFDEPSFQDLSPVRQTTCDEKPIGRFETIQEPEDLELSEIFETLHQVEYENSLRSSADISGRESSLSSFSASSSRSVHELEIYLSGESESVKGTDLEQSSYRDESDVMLQEAVHSIEESILEDSRCDHNDLLMNVCMELGISAEHMSFCNEEAQSAADILVALEEGAPEQDTDTPVIAKGPTTGSISLEKAKEENNLDKLEAVETQVISTDDNVGTVLHLTENGEDFTNAVPDARGVEQTRTKLLQAADPEHKKSSDYLDEMLSVLDSADLKSFSEERKQVQKKLDEIEKKESRSPQVIEDVKVLCSPAVTDMPLDLSKKGPSSQPDASSTQPERQRFYSNLFHHQAMDLTVKKRPDDKTSAECTGTERYVSSRDQNSSHGGLAKPDLKRRPDVDTSVIPEKKQKMDTGKVGKAHGLGGPVSTNHQHVPHISRPWLQNPQHHTHRPQQLAKYRQPGPWQLHQTMPSLPKSGSSGMMHSQRSPLLPPMPQDFSLKGAAVSVEKGPSIQNIIPGAAIGQQNGSRMPLSQQLSLQCSSPIIFHDQTQSPTNYVTKGPVISPVLLSGASDAVTPSNSPKLDTLKSTEEKGRFSGGKLAEQSSQTLNQISPPFPRDHPRHRHHLLPRIPTGHNPRFPGLNPYSTPPNFQTSPQMLGAVGLHPNGNVQERQTSPILMSGARQTSPLFQPHSMVEGANQTSPLFQMQRPAIPLQLRPEMPIPQHFLNSHARSTMGAAHAMHHFINPELNHHFSGIHRGQQSHIPPGVYQQQLDPRIIHQGVRQGQQFSPILPHMCHGRSLSQQATRLPSDVAAGWEESHLRSQAHLDSGANDAFRQQPHFSAEYGIRPRFDPNFSPAAYTMAPNHSTFLQQSQTHERDKLDPSTQVLNNASSNVSTSTPSAPVGMQPAADVMSATDMLQQPCSLKPLGHHPGHQSGGHLPQISEPKEGTQTSGKSDGSKLRQAHQAVGNSHQRNDSIPRHQISGHQSSSGHLLQISTSEPQDGSQPSWQIDGSRLGQAHQAVGNLHQRNDSGNIPRHQISNNVPRFDNSSAGVQLQSIATQIGKTPQQTIGLPRLGFPQGDTPRFDNSSAGVQLQSIATQIGKTPQQTIGLPRLGFPQGDTAAAKTGSQHGSDTSTTGNREQMVSMQTIGLPRLGVPATGKTGSQQGSDISATVNPIVRASVIFSTSKTPYTTLGDTATHGISRNAADSHQQTRNVATVLPLSSGSDQDKHSRKSSGGSDPSPNKQSVIAVTTFSQAVQRSRTTTGKTAVVFENGHFLSAGRGSSSENLSQPSRADMQRFPPGPLLTRDAIRACAAGTLYQPVLQNATTLTSGSDQRTMQPTGRPHVPVVSLPMRESGHHVPPGSYPFNGQGTYPPVNNVPQNLPPAQQCASRTPATVEPRFRKPLTSVSPMKSLNTVPVDRNLNTSVTFVSGIGSAVNSMSASNISGTVSEIAVSDSDDDVVCLSDTTKGQLGRQGREHRHSRENTAISLQNTRAQNFMNGQSRPETFTNAFPTNVIVPAPNRTENANISLDTSCEVIASYPGTVQSSSVRKTSPTDSTFRKLPAPLKRQTVQDGSSDCLGLGNPPPFILTPEMPVAEDDDSTDSTSGDSDEPSEDELYHIPKQQLERDRKEKESTHIQLQHYRSESSKVEKGQKRQRSEDGDEQPIKKNQRTLQYDPCEKESV